MSVRDKLRKPHVESISSVVDDLSWILNPTPASKALFQAAKMEFDRISNLIKSGDAKTEKERKLILAKIAKTAEKDRSLLNPRRQPEICSWISAKNEELLDLAKAYEISKSRPKPFTKSELKNQITQLHREQKLRSEDNLRNFVEEVFSSNLLDDRDKLARENLRLRSEKEMLLEKIARLQQENRLKNNNLTEILQVLTPSQRASLKDLFLT